MRKNIAADPYKYGYDARSKGVPIEGYIHIRSSPRDGMNAQDATNHFQELWKDGWRECDKDMRINRVVPVDQSPIKAKPNHNRDPREEPERVKTCPNCGDTYPTTLEFWYWRRTAGSRGKWAPRCKKCYQNEEKNRQRQYALDKDQTNEKELQQETGQV